MPQIENAERSFSQDVAYLTQAGDPITQFCNTRTHCHTFVNVHDEDRTDPDSVTQHALSPPDFEESQSESQSRLCTMSKMCA